MGPYMGELFTPPSTLSVLLFHQNSLERLGFQINAFI